MLKVVCFYWLGDRWQNSGLGPEYINKLFRGVSRHLSAPFQFICFTNEQVQDQLDEGITTKPINFPKMDGSVNLPRQYMFCLDSGLREGDQVLALDLDLVIVGSLNDIASYDGEFCARSKFKNPHKLDGDIVGFRPSEELEELFWNRLIRDFDGILQRTRGAERYWFRETVGRYFEDGDCDRWEELCPGQIVSFKANMKHNPHKLPNNARIVSCHGNPSPHQMQHEWSKEHWK